MQTRSLIVTALLVAGSGSLAAARAQNALPHLDATTPAACMKGANDWRNQKALDARNAGTSIDYSALLKDSQRMAAECAAQFKMESMKSADLPALADLYMYMGDNAAAQRAVDRAVAAPDLTPRQRGETIIMAMRTELSRKHSFGGMNPRLEQLADQLDALPDSLIDVKITGHQRILGEYGYADVDEGIRKHANIVIDLARKAGNRQVMVYAFNDLARTAADYLHPDSALMILNAAEKELGADMVKQAFSYSRAMYNMVGTHAATITGEHWLNADGRTTPVTPGNGTVLVVEFTAHWCVPCHESYPGMRRLAARFTGEKFATVFATELYGTFEGKKVTPEEELAADRVYFPETNQLPFLVAINSLPARTADAQATAAAAATTVNAKYNVAGIPQIVVIDKHGVIRQVVVGWDHGNEERLGRFIAQLLREPVT